MTLTKSKEETSEHIQSLSIEGIKALFANGTPVAINWTDNDVAEEDWLNNEDYFEKSALTGLSIETIKLIETQTREAKLGDVLIYCQSLGIELETFLISFGVGSN